MDKNTIIGFVLIAVVLSWYSQPSAEQIEAQRKEDSIAAVIKENAIKKQQAEAEARKAKADSVAMGDSTSLFFSALNGTNQEIVLKNDKVELTFDTKGGTISKALIKNFEDRDNNMGVILFDQKTQQMNFLLAGKQDNIITQDLYFTPSNVSDSTVTRLSLGQGLSAPLLTDCQWSGWRLRSQLQGDGHRMERPGPSAGERLYI